MDNDLADLLMQGQDHIAESTRAHAERWGLGSADRWSLDQREGRVVWTFADRVVSAPAQILGSWSSKAGSFVWAWDNATILEEMSRTAERVRAFGTEHDVVALTTSPLEVGEEQVRDLVALAFAIGGCTGLYHPYDGRLATYVVFGEVTIEPAGGDVEKFDVLLP
ncbi:hypothetical protein GCM10027596_26520 [Nocardioides korecus]